MPRQPTREEEEGTDPNQRSWGGKQQATSTRRLGGFPWQKSPSGKVTQVNTPLRPLTSQRDNRSHCWGPLNPLSGNNITPGGSPPKRISQPAAPLVVPHLPFHPTNAGGYQQQQQSSISPRQPRVFVNSAMRSKMANLERSPDKGTSSGGKSRRINISGGSGSSSAPPNLQGGAPPSAQLASRKPRKAEGRLTSGGVAADEKKEHPASSSLENIPEPPDPGEEPMEDADEEEESHPHRGGKWDIGESSDEDEEQMKLVYDPEATMELKALLGLLALRSGTAPVGNVGRASGRRLAQTVFSEDEEEEESDSGGGGDQTLGVQKQEKEEHQKEGVVTGGFVAEPRAEEGETEKEQIEAAREGCDGETLCPPLVEEELSAESKQQQITAAEKKKDKKKKKQTGLQQWEVVDQSRNSAAVSKPPTAPKWRQSPVSSKVAQNPAHAKKYVAIPPVGAGKFQQFNSGFGQPPKQGREKVVCFNCGVEGHKNWRCPQLLAQHGESSQQAEQMSGKLGQQMGTAKAADHSSSRHHRHNRDQAKLEEFQQRQLAAEDRVGGKAAPTSIQPRQLPTDSSPNKSLIKSQSSSLMSGVTPQVLAQSPAGKKTEGAKAEKMPKEKECATPTSAAQPKPQPQPLASIVVPQPPPPPTQASKPVQQRQPGRHRSTVAERLLAASGSSATVSETSSALGSTHNLSVVGSTGGTAAGLAAESVSRERRLHSCSTATSESGKQSVNVHRRQLASEEGESEGEVPESPLFPTTTTTTIPPQQPFFDNGGATRKGEGNKEDKKEGLLGIVYNDKEPIPSAASGSDGSATGRGECESPPLDEAAITVHVPFPDMTTIKKKPIVQLRSELLKAVVPRPAHDETTSSFTDSSDEGDSESTDAILQKGKPAESDGKREGTPPRKGKNVQSSTSSEDNSPGGSPIDVEAPSSSQAQKELVDDRNTVQRGKGAKPALQLRPEVRKALAEMCAKANKSSTQQSALGERPVFDSRTPSPIVSSHSDAGEEEEKDGDEEKESLPLPQTSSGGGGELGEQLLPGPKQEVEGMEDADGNEDTWWGDNQSPWGKESSCSQALPEELLPEGNAPVIYRSYSHSNSEGEEDCSDDNSEAEFSCSVEQRLDLRSPTSQFPDNSLAASNDAIAAATGTTSAEELEKLDMGKEGPDEQNQHGGSEENSQGNDASTPTLTSGDLISFVSDDEEIKAQAGLEKERVGEEKAATMSTAVPSNTPSTTPPPAIPAPQELIEERAKDSLDSNGGTGDEESRMVADQKEAIEVGEPAISDDDDQYW